MVKFNFNGQSLIEIIIAMAIGGVLLVGAASSIAVFLKGGYDTRTIQAANLLSAEYIDGLSSLAESNWNILYFPPGVKGSASQFYLVASGTTYSLLAGPTSTTIEGRAYTRYFSIENVNRDSCGVGNITALAVTACPAGPGAIGNAQDPSMEKITIYVNWPGSSGFSKAVYLSRNRNAVFSQVDWSAGPGQEIFATSAAGVIVNNKFATSTGAVNFSTPGAIQIQF